MLAAFTLYKMFFLSLLPSLKAKEDELQNMKTGEQWEMLNPMRDRDEPSTEVGRKDKSCDEGYNSVVFSLSAILQKVAEANLSQAQLESRSKHDD